MASARSVLILGASGFFGPALAAALGDRVAARTYYAHPIAQGIRFDAESTPVAQLPAADTAVILLGETRIDVCAREPERTSRLNVDGVMRVVHELIARGIKPVFVSSDAVFDGSRGLWTEEDEPRPILTYGRQKREVERRISQLPGPWLIVRLPKLLSQAPHPRCVLSQWIDALGERREIRCPTDQFFTPAAAHDAARGIEALLSAGATGLYHLGGPERLSRRELLHAVVDEYSKHAEVRAALVECRLAEMEMAERAPPDLSMDSTRFVSRCGALVRPASLVAREAVRARFGHV